MAQNITLLGASYSDVPAVELPKTGGGTASFTDVTDTTALASDVLQGKYFFNASGVLTLGTNQGGSGDGYVWQDSQGYVHLSDEEGTQPIYDTLTVSSSGTFTPATGHAYNSVVVPSGSATPASSISGTSATVSTGTNTLTLTKTVSNTPQVSAGYISSGTSGNTNVSLTASVNTRSSSDLSVSGATVTAPSGYYSSSASKSVASGTEGTPTATKGAVSNHSVNVTPSVTNTTGYITGSTKTGTAVTVSASELVSGTYTVDSSGTKDVTNYASVSVPSGTAGAPTATKGTASNNTISVTPSVTNTTGYITGSTKTGTAVSVAASELVSGTKSITENGTGIDVTNYASVDVNVSGSSSPTAKITSTGSSTYCNVRYPGSTGTKYYTLGDEFDIESGNILYFYASHSRGGGKIYLNGSVVAGDGYSSVHYSYTVKENESIEIELEVAAAESHIYITTIDSGGGGLEYEEGTYTTSEDVSSASISFSNTHTNVPFFVGFVDTTGDYNSTLGTAYAWWYFDWYELFGNGIYYDSTSQYYAYRNYTYRSTSATSMTGSTSGITSYPDTTNLTNTNFQVSFGGGYLRPNRTYKWIAVWKPTT